ncbi:isocitrate lyase/PEP mutase family protein [Candidatus Bathyarchaeota archaeon]|nr:isocitrate lyase/PEP mutase family protein [Candidatus Bathyarchaeota archaeon]
MSSKGKDFKRILNTPELHLRPCAYDALSALLIEKAGFSIVGTTGYGISASLIGQPDMGLIGYHEMLERTRTIVNAVDLPVDVDVDTGYGNALNIHWTVSNFARVGAASVRIEDQIWPKRCGHMAGKQVIPAHDMVQKIKAAVNTRDQEDPDMAIGARTDARTVTGFDDALGRATAYGEAGADYVYVEAPQSLGEVEKLVEKVPVPLAFNVIPGGKTPPFTFEELEERGVRYVSVPMICLYPAAKAMVEALDELRHGRDIRRIAGMGVSWAEFNDLVGVNRWRRLEIESLSEEELVHNYGTSNLEEIIRRELAGTEKVWKK